MINYKLLRNEIKNHMTQQSCVEILSFIGYEIDHNYKFKLREERTPSASISKTGKITDFGNGYSGDIVSVMHEFKGIPLGEATIYVAHLLNIDIERFRNV
jgi:DNA primase